MTDKQIIIDGVDVSGCPYYIDSECGCSSHDCECIKCIHNVCFYKDYKAKEQECEKLKATLKVIADRPCLNINDCNGNCLPHCKWNAHKLAQEALKELE